MQNLEKIGGLIAQSRIQKNMTQNELANKLNVTRQAVSKWERGEAMPDIFLLPKICGLLEINIDGFTQERHDDYQTIALLLQTQNYGYAQYLLDRIKQRDWQYWYTRALLHHESGQFFRAQEALKKAKAQSKDDEQNQKTYDLGVKIFDAIADVKTNEPMLNVGRMILIAGGLFASMLMIFVTLLIV